MKDSYDPRIKTNTGRMDNLILLLNISDGNTDFSPYSTVGKKKFKVSINKITNPFFNSLHLLSFHGEIYNYFLIASLHFRGVATLDPNFYLKLDNLKTR